MSQCPCGSGKEYDACCGPIIRGEQAAESAEALMRSRYTAYAKGEIEHLTESLHPSSRHDHDAAAARRWAAESQWMGLEVRSLVGGGAGDEKGEVEFVAQYRDKGALRKHHETGLFTKEEGRWYYLSGKQVKPETGSAQGGAQRSLFLWQRQEVQEVLRGLIKRYPVL